jgi:hypothetical protein
MIALNIYLKKKWGLFFRVPVDMPAPFESFSLQAIMEEMIRIKDRIDPRTITGDSDFASCSIKNFWGPRDIKHISPTIMALMYPILLRQKMSGSDSRAKERVAPIYGPTLPGGFGGTCAKRAPNITQLRAMSPTNELIAACGIEPGFSI